MKRFLFILLLIFYTSASAQYTMSTQTVYDCVGTLTDSEANTTNPGWYTNNENFSFTICPTGVSSIIIDFTFFMTEPNNDYIKIYDGPDTTFPLLAGPFSGVNLPSQIIANGCITINFVSDINVTSEGFELNWESQISTPTAPVISLTSNPLCSATVLNINLDQKIHCDSVSVAQILVSGQVNQVVNAVPVNCLNDSTYQIELSLFPGLNISGSYNIYLQSNFLDVCDSMWTLSSSFPFSINDCPLIVDIIALDDSTICEGDCIDLYANVSGGDSTSYNYTWTPFLPNNPGPHNICPNNNIIYSVVVSDAGPAANQADSITITVVPLPVTQPSFSICQTDTPIILVANPSNGFWSGLGVLDGSTGLFSAFNLPAGNNTVQYEYMGCEQSLDITILDINAGNDISVCAGSNMFNLNTSITTPGGIWSGSIYIQPNGDFTPPLTPTIISAIYSLPNGCSDTLDILVTDDIVMPLASVFCQSSGNYSLTPNPINGIWSVEPDNPQLISSCLNSIDVYPYEQGWENGFTSWINDPTNDFDWSLNSGPTNSGGTGPSSAYEDLYYIYTEASNPNNPSKRAGIISPCFNLSEYNNPVLHFWYHKYGSGQGSLAIDVSTDNGTTWNWNVWDVYGDFGDQWNQAVVNLSAFNTSEVLFRIRVVTGDNYKSDVAIDKLSVLAGPITPDGNFLTDAADFGLHNLTYSIQGCSDTLDIYVEEINAGVDYMVCPVENPFNLIGSPPGGLWAGLGVTNINLGTFDPSVNIGLNIITYSSGNCVDTAEIIVVDTDVQIDSLYFCINSGDQILDMSIVPRAPWNGVWSGNGITNNTFPGVFNPHIAGVGLHSVNYTANTCIDSLFIEVLPSSILLDTLICSSSPDIILNVFPVGGYWNGSGIIDNNIGLFSPTQVGVGTHYLQYTSLDNCVDTFIVNIYNSPNLSISGLDNEYCFIDSLIQISTTPAVGGVLSGNGIVGDKFNPSLAGNGYHNITYSFGTGDCVQSIVKQVFVKEELKSDIYFSDDSICNGDITIIGANANGGTGNYIFDWNNGLSNSFQHLVSPFNSTNYIVTISDNCSNNTNDTISIFVHSIFSTSFTTSVKNCYGDNGFAKVHTTPISNYTYLWSNGSNNDSIYDLVSKEYFVTVTNDSTGCSVEDTISIPGYGNISAYFTPNPTECISLLESEIQFINNSFIPIDELSNNSYWDFGDNTITNYTHYSSPYHNYVDTGYFQVKLYLENIGGCSDSIIQTVCINPENKFYIPNSFTPDYDNCNDEFYVKGLGGFESFEISVYGRWGGDVIFNSNEIILSNSLLDGNFCNNTSNTDDYYKMGSWDGIMENGVEAPAGVYGYVINYKQMSNPIEKIISGYIVLIR